MSGFIKGGDVAAHAGDTTSHGTTSAIVGVDDAQTLTNKTINTASNTITVSEADISDLQSYLLNITGEQLGDLSNVVLTTPANTEILQFNGTNWVNVAAGSVGVTDHTALSNIGTNTHAQIDTHIADSTIHFTQAAISITESQISDLQSYLLNITGESVGSLSDVTVSTPATRHVLVHNGSGQFVNRLLVEADISDLGSYLTSEVNDLTAAVTWANVPDANITQTSVTQHQAALSITESQISDLGSYITAAGVTYENLSANGDVGTGSTQVAQGDHNHSGVYEPANANIQSHISSTTVHVTKQLDTVQTTDATQTTLVTYAVPSDTVKHLFAVVKGRESATGDAIIKRLEIIVNNISGTAGILGSVQAYVAYETGATTWDITASVSSGNLLIKVTGEAAHTIDWASDVEIR